MVNNKGRKRMNAIIGAIFRWALTIGGAATAGVSDNDVTQAAGALATLLSLGWSIYQKIKANRALEKAQEPRTSGSTSGRASLLLALLVAASLGLTACKATLAPESEYTANSAVFTVQTVEKAVLQFPCAKDTTTPCVDRALAMKLKASRLSIMAALDTYHAARDTWVASGAEGDGAAVTSAFSALQAALTHGRALLATPEVQDIMNQGKE
jgi:hypothetical protein